MLSKLFKHEMRACARLLLPLYLVLIVCSLLDRIFLNLDIFNGVTEIIPGLITFAYILSLISIVIVSFVIIILRFYKNLITDEGFLMFTLPVKTRELINSKLIASILWTLISFIAVLASIFAVVINAERFQIMKDGLAEFFQEMHDYFGAYTALFIIELILILLLALIQSILQIYASVAIGQLLNGHKVLGSFAAYIGLYMFSQIFGVIVIAVADLFYKDTITDLLIIVKVILPALFLFLLVFTVAYYMVANFLFTKKLNLE